MIEEELILFMEALKKYPLEPRAQCKVLWQEKRRLEKENAVYREALDFIIFHDAAKYIESEGGSTDCEAADGFVECFKHAKEALAEGLRIREGK